MASPIRVPHQARNWIPAFAGMTEGQPETRAMSDYIPHTDDGFRTWAVNFAAKLTASPGTYMFTAAQAASIQSAVDDYVEKLEVADNELTRTKFTIAEKDDAKSVAENLCRGYAMLIKDNTGIADADKLVVGVRPINP